MQNLPIPLHIKNGIVEIDTLCLKEDARDDCCMLNVDNVNKLNQVIRERGVSCVKILKEIRDFKVGIYKMLYACKRLDMEGEDASSRVRDLQLLRVTSELNQVWPYESEPRHYMHEGTLVFPFYTITFMSSFHSVHLLPF